ncbi:hypothetical protein RF11_11204 [Thelohanellus kitauei]|uniref:Uncharacterized protein n=1 Tax=Thelohanellus kitauei TaxID=669202 RepID=A0A0C2MSF8_THEKT|nr:hypothetical protein RF11_11204 [Thelohanellus kitauei]
MEIHPKRPTKELIYPIVLISTEILLVSKKVLSVLDQGFTRAIHDRNATHVVDIMTHLSIPGNVDQGKTSRHFMRPFLSYVCQIEAGLSMIGNSKSSTTK